MGNYFCKSGMGLPYSVTEGRCWPLHRVGVKLRKTFFLHQSLPMLSKLLLV